MRRRTNGFVLASAGWKFFAILFGLIAFVTSLLLAVASTRDIVREPCSSPKDHVSANVPTLYINLETYTERAKDMVRVLGHSAHRIEAVNGFDIEEVKRKFHADDEAAFEAQPAQYVFSNLTTVLGQMGNYLSHLQAIRYAYEQKYEHVLVVEDDLNDAYWRIWPVDLQQLIKLADRKHERWRAIRLQWNDYSKKMARAYEDWVSRVSKYRSSISSRELDRLDQYWRDGDLAPWLATKRTPPPLLRQYRGGWGNMATLWSRAGLEHMVNTYSAPDGRWRCLAGRPCAADLSFWEEEQMLVVTPPVLGVRFTGKSTDEIRKGIVDGDHGGSHRQAGLAQLSWIMEASEMFKPDAHVGQFAPEFLKI